MSFVASIRSALSNRKSLYLPISAVALALVFIAALHPLSGGLGGFVFLLIGWAIPSVINLLLSAWIVSFVRTHWSLRILLFVLVSFVLGVNMSLPDLFAHAQQPIVSSEILRSVRVTSSTPLDDRLMVATQTPMDYSFGPSSLGVGIGGDEGCGCLYFVYGGHIRGYYEQLQDDIHQIKTDHKFFFFDPAKFPNAPSRKSPNGVHFDVKFTEATAMAHAVDVTVDVYVGFERTATYSQRNLPVPILEDRQNGRERSLKSEHFYAYCGSMLIRRNFWMHFLEDQMNVIPTSPFKIFLSKALQVT